MSPQFGESDDPQSYAAIGAGMEVHSELGPGFAEPVYQDAFAIELTLRRIAFKREHQLQVGYKGHRLACGYRPDFICFEKIIIELKALPKLTQNEISQTINYLKASGLHVGLLLNFGGRSLEYRRFVI